MQAACHNANRLIIMKIIEFPTRNNKGLTSPSNDTNPPSNINTLIFNDYFCLSMQTIRGYEDVYHGRP